MRIPFTKMHGAGNDYIYVNGFEIAVPEPERVSAKISDRRKGVGGDGLILIQPSKVAAARMEMYNADGSRGLMCGNGIRCVGKFVYDRGIVRDNPMRIETDCGIKTLDLEIANGEVTHVRVDMGEPILEPARIPVRFDGQRMVKQPLRVGGQSYTVTCVSMGNPHCVVFLPEVRGLELDKIGPLFAGHEAFPERVNTEFVRVIGRREVESRTWERGSGETDACGTGACAVVVAGALGGLTERSATVHLRGGDLDIDWRESDGHVFMRGNAVEVFQGEVEV